MKNLKNKLRNVGLSSALLIGLTGCGEKRTEPLEQPELLVAEYFFTSIADFNRKEIRALNGYSPIAGDFDSDGDTDFVAVNYAGDFIMYENRIPISRVENSEPEIKKSPEEY